MDRLLIVISPALPGSVAGLGMFWIYLVIYSIILITVPVAVFAKTHSSSSLSGFEKLSGLLNTLLFTCCLISLGTLIIGVFALAHLAPDYSSIVISFSVMALLYSINALAFSSILTALTTITLTLPKLKIVLLGLFSLLKSKSALFKAREAKCI